MSLPAMLILAVITTASPLPASPLKEIDASSAVGVCGRLVVHANAAIAATLQGDETVGRAIDRIAKVTLGGNAFARRSAGADVKRFAGEVALDADRSSDELRRLRDLTSPGRDPVAASELDHFSAALSEGITTERGMALALARISSYIDFSAGRDDLQSTVASITDNSDSGDHGTHKAMTGSAPGDAENNAARFQNAVVELVSGFTALREQEARAAGHSMAAVNGC